MRLEHFRNLTDALMSLPAIGKKSARNIALSMVTTDRSGALRLAHAIEQAVKHVRTCALCGHLSENELCDICADDTRERSKLCVVLSSKDIFTLEESGFYKGLYFVYTSEESFAQLEAMVRNDISEVIFAFAPSVQNDALIYFIEERLSLYGIAFTKIAQGVPTGVSLENVDMISLARALEGRVRI